MLIAFLSPKTYKKWEQKQLFIQQDNASEDNTTAETSGSGRVALNGSHDGSRDRSDSSRPKRRRKHLKVPNKFVKKQGERTWLVERFLKHLRRDVSSFAKKREGVLHMNSTVGSFLRTLNLAWIKMKTLVSKGQMSLGRSTCSRL